MPAVLLDLPSAFIAARYFAENLANKTLMALLAASRVSSSQREETSAQS
ncbi:MAG: hypothetical protein ACTS73_03050 [Arsenophonus sp. NEOnobi-MAG3]